MSTDQASFFFAVLGLVALTGGVAVVVLLGVAAVPSNAAGRLAAVRDDLGRAAVGLALVVATTSLLGSLYYSEVAHFVPCRLCWYQRIAMYPLVVILGIAVVLHDRGVWRYALPFAAIGAAISLYHYQLQLFPEQGSGACGPEGSCTVRYVEQFGFVSIPLMALGGFLSICALLLLARPRHLEQTGGP